MRDPFLGNRIGFFIFLSRYTSLEFSNPKSPHSTHQNIATYMQFLPLTPLFGTIHESISTGEMAYQEATDSLNLVWFRRKTRISILFFSFFFFLFFLFFGFLSRFLMMMMIPFGRPKKFFCLRTGGWDRCAVHPRDEEGRKVRSIHRGS